MVGDSFPLSLWPASTSQGSSALVKPASYPETLEGA